MAYTQFKQAIWARSLNLALRSSLSARAFVNTDYQGDAVQGNTVHITRPEAITIVDYTGGDIAVQVATATNLDLTIDYAKAFNFQVDDIDAIQANQDLMKVYLAEANYAMQNAVDIDIYSYLAANADSANVVGEAVTLTKANILEAFTAAMEKANYAKIPLVGRVACVSPLEHRLLVEAKALVPSTMSQDAVLATGSVGNTAGFEIILSTNLHAEASGDVDSGDPYHRYCIFGHSMSTTFASQVNKVEAYRTEKAFKDGLKGLINYGMKTIKPEALGVIKNKLGVAA